MVEKPTDLRQSEIENLDVTARGDENIRGLDIAVDDSGRVRGLQSIGYLDGQRNQGFNFG